MPAWSPLTLGLDFGVHGAVVCSWYGLSYYNHAVASIAAAANMDFEPPRQKRRKLDHHHHHIHHHSSSASSSSCNSSSANSGNNCNNTNNSEITHFGPRRGHVTFKPYSDNLGNCSSTGSDITGRPQKRKSSNGSTSGQAYPKELFLSRRGEANITFGKKKSQVEVNGGTTTNVEYLLPEILSMIFEYLDVKSKGRAARVCRKWRDSAYQKSVWRGIEAKLHLCRSNPTLFPSLVKRGIKKVQVLSLRKSLRELVNGLPNLESLNLSGCYNLTDTALDSAFSKEVPSLKSLNLSLCKEVNDNSLGRIATSCKNLEVLNLGGCSKITNTGLLLVSWGLKNIRKLNLRSCRQISDQGIGHLSGVESQPSNGSKSLEELCLQDCQKVTDEAMKHVSQGLPNLKALNLSFCVSITDSGLKSLSNLNSLRDLNLRSCDNVSDLGIGFLSETGEHLSALDVSFCTNVTDSALKHIASGMTGLGALSMTTCPISDEGLEKLAKNLKGLKTLNIGQCTGLTDRGLILLAQHNKSLKKLDLYGLPKVNNAAIDKVRLMPSLRQLNLTL